MYLSLAILVSFAFLYSIVAGRIEKSPFSGPLAFIALVAVLLMGYVEGLLSKVRSIFGSTV